MPLIETPNAWPLFLWLLCPKEQAGIHVPPWKCRGKDALLQSTLLTVVALQALILLFLRVRVAHGKAWKQMPKLYSQLQKSISLQSSWQERTGQAWTAALSDESKLCLLVYDCPWECPNCFQGLRSIWLVQSTHIFYIHPWQGKSLQEETATSPEPFSFQNLDRTS